MDKILWHSNAPQCPTGYGQQTALFAPRLRALGYDVALSANYGLSGAAGEWEGMHLYPMDDAWGQKWLPACASHHSFNGDPTSVLIVTLMDVWVLRMRMWRQLNVASWCPVDHAPLPPLVREYFALTEATPIAMSRFGERMLGNAGLEPLYVPHGVDTTIYRELDRDESRRLIGLPQDAFVVGMVAANTSNSPPRKSFAQVFAAFAELHRRHSDAMLYLHTDLEAGAHGVNLAALLEICGVPQGAVCITPPFELFHGVAPERMAHVYSALDVLANPSYGEGFGIPIIEAQACGTPVVVNDFSAMPELCGAGWAVDGEPFYNPHQGSYSQAPSVSSLVEAFEESYAHAAELREQARTFALDYDADRVTREHWAPALEKLVERRELPAVLDVPRLALRPAEAAA